jgi:hypothetical protein
MTNGRNSAVTGLCALDDFLLPVARAWAAGGGRLVEQQLGGLGARGCVWGCWRER